MKKYVLIIFLILIFTSCRKRDDIFSFAGVWIIEKVEQVIYQKNLQTHNVILRDDSLGYFALSTIATPANQIGNYKFKYQSLIGFTSSNMARWYLNANEVDRLIIDDEIFIRKRIKGGEKWTWIFSPDNGVTYSRETIFVRHQ